MTWLQVPEAATPEPGTRGAYLLRTEFELPAAPLQATIRISALGLYEAYLNGAPITADVLTPGYTQYAERVQFQEYEVSALLVQGANAIAVLLADGWYRGKVSVAQISDVYGDRVALFAELIVRCSDGTEVVVDADATWHVGPSHIVTADLFDGQFEDRRLRDESAYHPGFADVSWDLPIRMESGPRLVEAIAPPVRRVEELVPVSVTELSPGHHVVDLGQNINGWTKLLNLGPEGTTVTMTHGEWLDPNTGDVCLDNLIIRIPNFPPNMMKQQDVVVSAGRKGDFFEPQFTTHGFQYVRIEGHPGPLGLDDVRGVVVHTGLEEIGGFECSHQDLNALHDAAVWSFRDNACDIPTDCPTRERSGWTGDWQLYCPTAAYLYDVDAFSRKWLADVIIDQHPDGRIPNISPLETFGGWEGPVAHANASAGWGDAIVSVPLDLYNAYGTTDALEQCWEAATRWIDFSVKRAESKRHPSRVERSAQALAHENYLVDTGFHWGEWLEPGVDIDFPALSTNDQANHGTAYLYRSALQMAQIARLLNKGDEVSRRYSELAKRAREAWQIECVNADGSLVVDTQASYVRALHFGLLPEELREGAVERLVELIGEADMHLGTGFLSTPYLLPVLAENGRADIAFELLLQDTPPSWLYMIKKGATTIWEWWEGVDANNWPHESLNHYSKGAVISFLHHYVAGLRPTSPGYKSFVVRPLAGGGVTSARTWHVSPFGRIDVSWELIDGQVQVDVQAPQECTWEVQL